MNINRLVQVALALVGIALAVASIPALRDDALLGVVGVVGGVLIVVGAILAYRRGARSSADRPPE